MNEIEKFSSQADNQNKTFAEQDVLKQQAIQDIKLIENLVQAGVMTQEQGLNLVNFVTNKAFDKYTKNVNTPQTQGENKNESLEIAKITDIPEFFKQDGRSDVYNYLQDVNFNFDEDEISKISNLVEKIEASAIEKYLREKEHEKTLNLENESAKQRLRANAQNSCSDGTKNLVFTREQIGKMSGKEFAKHERAIMDQLRKGLIK